MSRDYNYEDDRYNEKKTTELFHVGGLDNQTAT